MSHIFQNLEVRPVDLLSFQFDPEMVYVGFLNSLGDTFNGLLTFAKYLPLRDYSIICKEHHLDILNLILPILEKPPSAVFLTPYIDNDLTSIVFYLNKHIKVRSYGFFPNIDFPGIYSYGHSGYQNNFYSELSLTERDIGVLTSHFSAIEPAVKLPNNSVVFFPNTAKGPLPFDYDWNAFRYRVTSSGKWSAYLNHSGKSAYEEVMQDGLSVTMSIRDVIGNFYDSQKSCHFIAVRSGIVDVLRFSKSRGIVLYHPVNNHFELCRLGHYQNNIDFVEVVASDDCPAHTNKLIDYYIDRFLISDIYEKRDLVAAQVSSEGPRYLSGL